MALSPLAGIELFSGVGMLGEGLRAGFDHPGGAMKTCPTCKTSKPESEFVARSRGGLYAYCKPCHNERSRPKTPEQFAARRARNVTYRAKIRADMLAAYGGKCECCGESHAEFLALDHRNGGGTKERKALPSNTSGGVYRLARDAGYPKDKYRLLCHNCNCALGWYGYCPHTKESSCG
jgi:hypothetical protein